MLLPIVIVFCCVCIVALFVFAYLMDKWHGCFLVAVLAAWVLTMQPARAADDTNWPTIAAPGVPMLMAHNVVGDRIVLFANFCAGDGARRDHMHTYGVYNSHGAFVQGGCWKYDPVGTHKTGDIAYFSMSAYGWDKWPFDAFKKVPSLNVKCRGDSGDDPQTQLYCTMRDAF